MANSIQSWAIWKSDLVMELGGFCQHFQIEFDWIQIPIGYDFRSKPDLIGCYRHVIIQIDHHWSAFIMKLANKKGRGSFLWLR